MLHQPEQPPARRTALFRQVAGAANLDPHQRGF